jgi:hypothetical protein
LLRKTPLCGGTEHDDDAFDDAEIQALVAYLETL